MAVRQLRRLTAPSGDTLYDRVCRETLHDAWRRPAVNEIAAGHPDLVIEREGNILAALPTMPARLVYGFHGDRDFVQHFPPMFEALLPRLRKFAPDGRVRFRLSHAPSRTAIEPVLKRLLFDPHRTWLMFSLDRRAGVLKTPAVRGVTFREGSIADISDLVRIDREVFPSPAPESVIRSGIEGGARVLVASVRGRIVGFAQYVTEATGDGYLETLAVEAAQQRRGIGASLTARVARRVFADGASRLDLRTQEENGAAIRLYLSLGFRQSGAGRDYVRPIDARAVERLRSERRGTLIRFGGWR